MKNNQEERKIKPVSFNLNNEWDCKLLEHAESSGKSFSVYIKNLIEKDIYEVNQNNINNINNSDIVEAINNVAKILESKSFKVESKEKACEVTDEKALSEDDKESKNIISSILKMGGKKD